MPPQYSKFILVKDTGSSGDGTKRFCDALNSALREAQMADDVQVVAAADMNIYDRGIVVQILPAGICYAYVEDEDAGRIVGETLKNDRILEDLLYKAESRQVRLVLRNCGVVDPENIEDYIVHDGYQALRKVLTTMTPDQVIAEMKTAGLRGRGGGGFPTWLKWDITKKVGGQDKYIICNGDEGDPGAYMDRSVLEGDPHSVLEGMMIGGYAIGATQGFLYIRAEYPLAVARVERALQQMRSRGLLGKNIFGSGFSFDMEIRLGAGAFVCGEETALIASIEGKRGCPVPRPPYPSVKGLWGHPTVINNVETLANVPAILLNGGEEFARLGTETAKGTKVFALTGKVRNSGLIEVPMGISLREIVFEIGGGAGSGRAIKAIQTGGPSGGVIPEEFFDTPVDYEHLQRLGSIMGSGGMIVMDETDCVVDIAKFYLGFCVDESCGKCAPCRIGGVQLLEILKDISEGRGTDEDLEKLKDVSAAMQKASLCGLGQTAPNPVLSTLRYFRDEYEAHIRDRRCPSEKCKGLLQYTILQDKCKRCSLCQRNCPVAAISGDREQGYLIDPAKCVKCGRCFDVCKFGAIAR